MKTKISDIEAIEIFKGIAPSSIIEIKNNSDVIELKRIRHCIRIDRF